MKDVAKGETGQDRDSYRSRKRSRARNKTRLK
jgi:hypothetical protein